MGGGGPDSGLGQELARIDALHTALTTIVLGGGDLGGIAAEASRVLQMDVLFTSTDGRQWVTALNPATTRTLADAGMLDTTGRVRIERISRGGPIEHGEVRMLRVAAGGADLARLVAVCTDRAIGAADIQALERAAAVAALLITREQAVTAVENKYQGDFLRDVLLGRAGDEQYMLQHTVGFGWDLQHPSVVLVAMIDPDDDRGIGNSQRRAWQERFAAGWRRVSREIDPAAVCVDYSSEVVTVLPVRTEEEVAATVQRVTTGVAGDRGGGRRPFSVGVSRRTGGLHDLPDGYHQARRALDVGRRTRGTSLVTHFDELGVHRLIALIEKPDELRSYVADVLGPLAQRTKAAAELRATLQALLDTNFNVAEASRQQFFHYNTMRYRMGKIERLLGPLSTDPQLRLNIAVALQAYEFAR